MGDYHRIHPVTVGSPPPPSAPPEQASRGKKPSHEQLQLPVTAPAPGAPAPLPPPPRRKRHSRCCRCVCCTLLAVVILVVALAATAGILYLVFRPKIPNFRVDRLTVTRFDVNTTTMTVTDAFDVDVTATNPNKRIGIYYDGGEVTASFNGTQLCRGDFPTLYQGHRTTVQPRITLTGETRLDSAVVAQLAQQRQAGFVPLTVRARVPIRIKFGAIKLWKMTGKADCNLVVDNLQAGTQLRIRSNSCSFKLKI
ncbi:protein YLS9-like [Panicum miliaceum]|uniref:Protein YLS9-like n=1 Tax=Panicum miliaceum TaxID=4540 RepID=A0A3L6PVK6_PANMI|nr:protein YLS9-like [Panicum miliaceum]